MLTRLRFKNFKAWQDSGEIRLAPLTVLFGANSAGKTSIPQLLLMLKQTSESPDRQRALQLGDNRTIVDLGTYDDAVHNHDTSRPLDIELEWTLPRALDISDPLTQKSYSGTRVDLAVSFGADKRHQPYVQWLRYELRDKDAVVLDIAMKRRETGSKYDLESKTYPLVRQVGRPWPLPEPVRFYGFPDEATAHYQNTAFLSDLVLELERMLKSLFYVGPLREYPKRLYLWSGETPDHVGQRGDRAVEAILAAGDRTFNWKPKQRTKPLAELVAERLRAMHLISDFEVKPLATHRKEYEVLVRTSRKLPAVKLTDVGFGISQVLPVIVEALYVPRRSIVILEQPEIHLHPRAGRADRPPRPPICRYSILRYDFAGLVDEHVPAPSGVAGSAVQTASSLAQRAPATPARRVDDGADSFRRVVLRETFRSLRPSARLVSGVRHLRSQRLQVLER
jgi:hypothetical protein